MSNDKVPARRVRLDRGCRRTGRCEAYKPEYERAVREAGDRKRQAHFVDAPSESIMDADLLVTETMQAKGYPMSDFEQRAADVSVDHPRVVEHYRAARAISLRNQRSEASTEDLRQAMVHYRELFEDLLEPRSNDEVEVRAFDLSIK